MMEVDVLLRKAKEFKKIDEEEISEIRNRINELKNVIQWEQDDEKRAKLREENESLDDVLKRLIETYEEVEEYIKEKWEKLQRDKDKFVDLEDYASSRGL